MHRTPQGLGDFDKGQIGGIDQIHLKKSSGLHLGEPICILEVIYGGGGAAEYNDMGAAPFDIGGNCLTTPTNDCSSPEDSTWLRAGADGFCEETFICSSNADCPGGSFCFFDGHCLTDEGLDSLGLSTCDPAVGCEESSSDVCVSIVRGDSTCGNYCMGENIVRPCLTDTDCDDDGGVCIGENIEEEKYGFCSWGVVSTCE